MDKVIGISIMLVVLNGLVYGQEAPEDGVSKTYYESGQLKEEVTFKDGITINSKAYDESGKLESEQGH